MSLWIVEVVKVEVENDRGRDLGSVDGRKTTQREAVYDGRVECVSSVTAGYGYVAERLQDESVGMLMTTACVCVCNLSDGDGCGICTCCTSRQDTAGVVTSK